MHLHDHFARNVPAALDAYAREALRRVWSLHDRLELYGAAKVAFDPGPDRPEDAKRAAFERIYGDLRRRERVFLGAREHWKPDEVRGALLGPALAPYSRASGTVLLGLVPVEHKGLRAAFKRLRPLKATRRYPAMAVSKFLHLFNPACFPAYDAPILEGYVIHRFRSDYAAFRRAEGLDGPDEDDDDLLLRYTAFARSCVVAGGPALMPTFAAWFRAQVRGCPDPENVLDDLTRCYAAAFELVAVGAAFLP